MAEEEKGVVAVEFVMFVGLPIWVSLVANFDYIIHMSFVRQIYKAQFPWKLKQRPNKDAIRKPKLSNKD